MTTMTSLDTTAALEHVRRLVIAGFTGRNRADVQAHLDELAAEGVPVPDEVPTFYDVPRERLTTAAAIAVASPESSGEVEPVLVRIDGEYWFGIGSDHTARDVERDSIAAGKQACDKVLGPRLWRFDAVSEAFDDLRLRSWARKDDRWVLYQDATAASMLHPQQILDRFETARGDIEDGLVIFLGTVPLLTHGFLFAEGFRATIEDSLTGDVLELAYDIEQPKPAQEQKA